MISNSIRQSREAIDLYLLESGFDKDRMILEIPELTEVFMSQSPSSDYPAWETLLEGLDLPALNSLDLVYGSIEL